MPNEFLEAFEYGELAGVGQTSVPIYDEPTDQRSSDVLWYGDEPDPPMA